MAKAARTGATPLHHGLPDEIVFWEILVRLPPKSLLRCRAVSSAWRHVTSTRDFLLAHHARQPSLPIVRGFKETDANYRNISFFNIRAAVDADAQLQSVARLSEKFWLEASCDGILVLSDRRDMFANCFSICNPATREHAPLHRAWGLRLLGMYLHRPTDEYRLLLHRSSDIQSFLGPLLSKGKIGCYIFALGSDQPLRYIGGEETASTAQFEAPALVHDSLHWYQPRHQNKSELVLVFDTITESFRQMRPPVMLHPTTKSYIFETEGTLGMSSYNDAMKTIGIWMLRNYEGEVWVCKYRVKLPITDITRQIGSSEDNLHVSVVSVDGDVLLLLKHRWWMFYVHTGGELIGGFHHDSQTFSHCELRLKQSLVSHTFFTELEGHDVNHSPFVDSC